MLRPDHQGRLAKARAALSSNGFEALLIFSLENLRYLTGYSGEAAYGILTRQQIYLITDYRFADQAHAECTGCNVICRDRDRETLGEVFNRVLSDESVHRFGIETEHLSYDSYISVKSDLGPAEMFPANGTIEALRINKDEWEVECIEKAAAIADIALDALIAQLAFGVTERDMARELDYLMKSHGADDAAFPTILGFGANSAKPHCVPSQRPLMQGDFVLIDFGAEVSGYRSDMTRTFVAGKPSAQQALMMNTVLEAQQSAIAAVRAGVTGRELDQQSSRILDSSPYGRYAGKGLGHGVGLKLHERPFLGPKCEEVLRAGCVVTVEPGLYIPGYGGVRYEDDILVEESGGRYLTKAPKFFELEI